MGCGCTTNKVMVMEAFSEQESISPLASTAIISPRIAKAYRPSPRATIEDLHPLPSPSLLASLDEILPYKVSSYVIDQLLIYYFLRGKKLSVMVDSKPDSVRRAFRIIFISTVIDAKSAREISRIAHRDQKVTDREEALAKYRIGRLMPREEDTEIRTRIEGIYSDWPLGVTRKRLGRPYWDETISDWRIVPFSRECPTKKPPMRSSDRLGEELYYVQGRRDNIKVPIWKKITTFFSTLGTIAKVPHGEKLCLNFVMRGDTRHPETIFGEGMYVSNNTLPSIEPHSYATGALEGTFVSSTTTYSTASGYGRTYYGIHTYVYILTPGIAVNLTHLDSLQEEIAIVGHIRSHNILACIEVIGRGILWHINPQFFERRGLLDSFYSFKEELHLAGLEVVDPSKPRFTLVDDPTSGGGGGSGGASYGRGGGGGRGSVGY